ncbi:glycoside hydrolase family 3 N-terminal domain-containing protein [uncultured Lactobacillus sp.]|uniref:glycoside hydrolase family 3 protein n=1 Tax=uncultured Lactobacillus sp. TaxID=153152 RepID=UPI0028054E4A|nr:glycoside hydrolase family 3 N-terminal domain-containing protein [uncultured Lactobacillus sp.]
MKKKILFFTALTAVALIAAGCSHQIKSNAKSFSSKKIKVIKKKKKKPSKIDRIFKHMTLDEKIGQLYFAHSTGDYKQMKKDINQYHLGGTTLFAPDYTNRTKSQFDQEMQNYQKASDHGLLIATDQEGGTVSRIDTNPDISQRKYPSPQDIYNADGLKGIKKENTEVAQILRQNGINTNFAPVTDVAKDKNSFIFKRTLGQDYKTTAKYIPVAVKSIQDQKVASCLKHFPSYGDAGDTHTGFAQINKPLSEYEKEDLLPFKAGIKAGVDSIMISHIVIKDIDAKLPASLSPAVHKLLRNKLNYHGLMITDDLQMGAITQYAKQHHVNADVLALKAGNDMLLGGNYQTGIPAIKSAVRNGSISKKQIDNSVRKVLLLKEKLGILK